MMNTGISPDQQRTAMQEAYRTVLLKKSLNDIAAACSLSNAMGPGEDGLARWTLLDNGDALFTLRRMPHEATAKETHERMCFMGALSKAFGTDTTTDWVYEHGFYKLHIDKSKLTDDFLTKAKTAANLYATYRPRFEEVAIAR